MCVCVCVCEPAFNATMFLSTYPQRVVAVVDGRATRREQLEEGPPPPGHFHGVRVGVELFLEFEID